MAPTKATKPFAALTKRPLTRTQNKVLGAADMGPSQPRAKRKADASPLKEAAVKRSAFSNITNVTSQNKANEKVAATKKVTAPAKQLPPIRTVYKAKQSENVAPPPAPVAKVQTRASLRNSGVNHTAQKPKEAQPNKDSKIKTRLSNEFEKTEDSLYSSALENVDTPPTEPVNTKPRTRSDGRKSTSITLVTQQFEKQLNLGNHEVPEGVNDFDKENWNDVFQVSHYTMDIFNYLKSREPVFAIPDYMDKQVCLTKWMRSLLVDWMVEIQESFELNHETLYLGVKLVDMYLSKVLVGKETLQLVGAASMFIASKFDERVPPLVDDFLYICDGAYTRKELLRTEINLLKICDYDLGIPLSYRFLRRYARCAKVTMPVLTLARYILEYSLMDYATVTIPDSKLAAASLYLALQMKHISGWNDTLHFYSGYKLDEILSTVHLLNNGLHRKPVEQLSTVRNKYSHKIFFEVAKTALIKNEQLQP